MEQKNSQTKIKPSEANKLAIKKLKQGLFQEAKTIYQSILSIQPNNKKALDGINMISRVSGIKNSKRDEPPQEVLLSLSELIKQGKFEETLDNASSSLTRFPNSVSLHNIKGVANKKLGLLNDSINDFQHALSLNPNFADAHYNIALTFSDLSKTEDAVKAYKKAVSINPKFTEAYNNMGILLAEQDKQTEALKAYKNALLTNSNYADAHFNIGYLLQTQGNLVKAKKFYNKAISIRPNYIDAHLNMANLLQLEGKSIEALQHYTHVLTLDPNNINACINISNSLRRIEFQKNNPKFTEIISWLLKHKTYVKPIEVSRATISLLKLEPAIIEVTKKNSEDNSDDDLFCSVLALSQLPLLLSFISVCVLPDQKLEKLLRDIRSSLLLSVAKLHRNNEILPFQSALALHCFTNEYIYLQSEKETKALDSLVKSVNEDLLLGQQPSPQILLCIASYRAIHEYDWSNLLMKTPETSEVYIRQLTEPEIETELKTSISTLDNITNEVSKKVKAQYEENPYPRWVNLKLPSSPSPITKIVKETEIKLFDQNINHIDSPVILIAGCGTGSHALETAVRFKNSKIIAVDLSLSSLAYAKRKTDEFGVKNIDYIQADILDVSKLNQQFDIIESAGVLHHMDKPIEGWKVLTSCLKDGGLMKIGLYSELARMHIVKIRSEIKQRNIKPTNLAIRAFRDQLFISDDADHKRIAKSTDFYSLSNFRDLIFHEQEHRFTLIQIWDCLRELGLKFCGFERYDALYKFKEMHNDPNDIYDMRKWISFEESNPNVFAEMYQFWCQK